MALESFGQLLRYKFQSRYTAYIAGAGAQKSPSISIAWAAWLT